MPYETHDLLEALRSARRFFLRHVEGLTDEQWAHKPYQECKSPLETVAHLIADDRCALDCLRTGEEPDYAAYDVAVTDRDALLADLAASHEALSAYVAERHGDAPLDAEVCIYGAARKLGDLAYLTAEDYYHAGQVAFVRMATEPGWDYYEAVYGAGE
jgi:uncharacterized damage-inducible protein DinB